jgi:hypothetical protein
MALAHSLSRRRAGSNVRLLLWSCFTALSASSFLAIGPPGAPKAEHIGHSLEFDEIIQSLHANDYPLHEYNATVASQEATGSHISNGSSALFAKAWYQNLTTEETLSAASLALDEEQRAQIDYWFYTDPKFKHLVSAIFPD